VVVRDRRGQIVGDLSREDFEVFEDGVRQTIGAFTRVFDGEPSSPAALPPQASGGTTGGVGSPAPVNSGPGVTALVFHGLSPEGRRLALQATQNYLGSQEEMANYVGVFGIDLSLRPLVPFTRNGVAVRRALAAIGSGSSPGFDAQEYQ
jgi:VWFA-related protein